MFKILKTWGKICQEHSSNVLLTLCGPLPQTFFLVSLLEGLVINLGPGAG